MAWRAYLASCIHWLLPVLLRLLSGAPLRRSRSRRCLCRCLLLLLRFASLLALPLALLFLCRRGRKGAGAVEALT